MSTLFPLPYKSPAEKKYLLRDSPAINLGKIEINRADSPGEQRISS
jgi:hypothetical protein